VNGTAVTLRALYHGESHLTEKLRKTAERHASEHEIHHIATDLAQWSSQHRALLEQTAEHYGLDLTETRDHPFAGVSTTVRQKIAEAIGRRPEPALPLLHDLHDLYLAASSNSLYWEMLAQLAQATHDRRLLRLATDCHPQTLRQIRWANTMIKTLSPQALTSL
jgi:hypothetical protein